MQVIWWCVTCFNTVSNYKYVAVARRVPTYQAEQAHAVCFGTECH